MSKRKSVKQRDFNIVKAYRGEINLCTRVKRDKSKYSRKIKHPNKAFDL